MLCFPPLWDYNLSQETQWNDLANSAKGAGFKAVRILAFDCNALTLASSAATSAGLQVIVGIYFDVSSVALQKFLYFWTWVTY
jgi:exo-beta-1,3-glucanase (GH17 family)